MMHARGLAIWVLLGSLAAVEPTELIRDLLDPVTRGPIWDLVADAGGCGPALTVWPIGTGAALVRANTADMQGVELDSRATLDDRYPDLDLAALLPELGRPCLPDPEIVFSQKLIRVDLDRLAAEMTARTAAKDAGVWAPPDPTGLFTRVEADAVLDLDGDGRPETVRVETVSGTTRKALRIRIVRHDRPAPQPACDLLCPAESGWTTCLRRFPSGPALLAGPDTDGVIAPVLRLAWDGGRSDWVWTSLQGCRRLPSDCSDEAIKAQVDGLPSVPTVKPPAASLEERILAALGRPEAAVALAGLTPLQARSLLDPATAKRALQLEHLRTERFPEACWTLPPAAAALVFARANRKRSDEARWPLRVEPVAPPLQGQALMRSWCSAHGPNGTCSQGYTLLRLAGADSALIQASRRQSSFYELRRLEDRFSTTLKVTPLDEATARQGLAVLAHLAQVRDAGGGKGIHWHSTDSSDGLLSIDGVTLVGGHLGGGSPAESWSGPVDDIARHRLAASWVRRALGLHLGLTNPPSTVDHAAEQRAARDILVRWRPQRLPDAVAGIAAQALADADVADLPGLLGDLPAEANTLLREARERSLRHLALLADQAALKRTAAADGPDRIWAIRGLAKLDPVLATSLITQATASETDPERVKAWTALARWVNDHP